MIYFDDFRENMSRIQQVRPTVDIKDQLSGGRI
jgi:hypothetical protein